VGWLRRNRVLLPGVSVLARLVASVRDSAAERMHRSLADAAAAADFGLPARLRGWLPTPTGFGSLFLSRPSTRGPIPITSAAAGASPG
jgi:hypothetical protein